MKAQKLCCTTVVLTIFDIGIVCAFRLGRNGPPSSGRSAVRAPPVEAARRLGHEAAVSDSRAGPPRRAASGPGTSTGSCARPPSTRPRGGPPGRAARGRSCAPGHVRATEHQAVRARGHTDRPSPAGRAEHEHEQLHEAAGHQTAGHEAAVSDGQARPRTRPQLRTGPPSTRRSERGATPTGRVRPAEPSTRPPRQAASRPGRARASAGSCAGPPSTRPAVSDRRAASTGRVRAAAGRARARARAAAPGGRAPGRAPGRRQRPPGRAKHQAATARGRTDRPRPAGRVRPAEPSTRPHRQAASRPGRARASASSCAGPPSTRPAVSDRRAASTGRVRAAAGRARARARAAAPGRRAPGPPSATAGPPRRAASGPQRAGHEHEREQLRPAAGHQAGHQAVVSDRRAGPSTSTRPPRRAASGPHRAGHEGEREHLRQAAAYQAAVSDRRAGPSRGAASGPHRAEHETAVSDSRGRDASTGRVQAAEHEHEREQLHGGPPSMAQPAPRSCSASARPGGPVEAPPPRADSCPAWPRRAGQLWPLPDWPGGRGMGLRPGCHAPEAISAAMPAARRRDSPYCRASARCDSGTPAATDAR